MKSSFAILKTRSFAPSQSHARGCATDFAGGQMHIVYDSQNYHVIEYSGIGGYEVTNKSEHVCAYFHGQAAAAFRDDFARVIAANPSIDSVDEYLGGFDSLMTLPIVLH